MKRKRQPNKNPAKAKDERPARHASKSDLLIVAIGASAGGIEAFGELVRNLPTDTGMAFALIQHLDPKHHSYLTELLSKVTEMVVSEVKDGMRVEPNHVYVIPPNTTMSIADHTLQLRPREESRGVHPARISRAITLLHGGISGGSTTTRQQRKEAAREESERNGIKNTANGAPGTRTSSHKRIPSVSHRDAGSNERGVAISQRRNPLQQRGTAEHQ